VLAEKPWRLDALVRLGAGVLICVFMGSALAGALEFSPAKAAIRPEIFYALTAGAVAFSVAALALALRRGAQETLSRRFLWLLLCLFLSLNLAAWVQYLAGAGLRETYSFAGVVVGTVSFQGVALVLICWFLHEHRIGWNEAFGFGEPRARRAVLLGMLVAGAAVAFQFGYVQLLSLVRFSPEEQHVVQVVRLSNSVLGRAYLAVATITFVPVAEEMLFRGILYPTIKQLGFPRLALWGTALLFAAIHLNLASFVPLTLLAVALALLYEKTNNLLAPIVTHSCFNAMNFAMLCWEQNIEHWLHKVFGYAASP
jgi:membrane protease YdiL (CAAX protease family)